MNQFLKRDSSKSHKGNTIPFFSANNIYPNHGINQQKNNNEQSDIMNEKVMTMPEKSYANNHSKNSNHIFKPNIATNNINKVMLQRSSMDSPTQEEGTFDEEETTNTPPTIQRLEALNQSTATNHNPNIKYPWSSRPHAGYDYFLHTDRGTPVVGWVGFRNIYWCHGHSLNTFNRWSYSIYSGSDMRAVVNDEYNPVVANQVRQGDIAVWEPSFGHSAKFEYVTLSNNSIDEQQTTMSTKNGSQPLTNKSLAQVRADYSPHLPNSVINYYRHV